MLHCFLHIWNGQSIAVCAMGDAGEERCQQWGICLACQLDTYQLNSDTYFLTNRQTVYASPKPSEHSLTASSNILRSLS